MRPRIGRVVASPRKSVACTSLRTSRYLIRNSSCFTNDCVAADKPSLSVSVWEVSRTYSLENVSLCTKCGSDGIISDKYCCFWLRFLSL